MSRTLAVALLVLGGVPATAEPPPHQGEVCTRAMLFDLEVGALPEEEDDADPESAIGCDFAPPIDPGERAWVMVDVPKVPRYVRAHVKIKAAETKLEKGAELSVLTIGRSRPDAPSAAVLLGFDDEGYYVRLGWYVWDSNGPELKRWPLHRIGGDPGVLTLLLDRGRSEEALQQPDLMRLLVNGVEAYEALAGVANDVLPSAEPGEPQGAVKFGLLDVIPGDADVSGRLVFRPLGVETGWGDPGR